MLYTVLTESFPGDIVFLLRRPASLEDAVKDVRLGRGCLRDQEICKTRME